MSRKKEDIQEDIFNEVAQEASRLTDEELTNASEMMQRFFEDDEMSPRNFKDNTIVSADGNGFFGSFEYYPGTDVLFLCSASLKACPYPLDNMSVEEKYIKEQEELSKSSASPVLYDSGTLLIYGHPLDVDDEFNSRIDKDMSWKFSDKFSKKFRRVILSGAFKDIPEMRSVLFELYTKLVYKSSAACIEITADSRVRDDDEKERTVASLVRNGYVKPGILDNPRLVKMRYELLSPEYYAKLFTKKLDIKQMTLFDDDEDEDAEDNNIEMYI